MTCAGQHAFMTLVQDAKYKRTRRSLLHEEYVEGQKGGGVGQPESGFKVSLLGLTYHSDECQSVWQKVSLTTVCHSTVFAFVILSLHLGPALMAWYTMFPEMKFVLLAMSVLCASSLTA